MRSAPRSPPPSTMLCKGLAPWPNFRSRRSGCANSCAQQRRADPRQSNLTLGWSCIGGDEMRHLRIAGAVEAEQFFLQQTVRLGDALVLAQMLHPAFDQKSLENATLSCAASSNTP